jgi:hypothetical protein
MNLATVDQIAKAVLYEGYMLYPYRPSSVKNQQRWNFGVVCPESYSQAQKGTEACTMQTECLVEGNTLSGLEVRIRFLQLVARSVGQFAVPISHWSPEEPSPYRPVEKLTVNGRKYQPWQEAIEREVILPRCSVEALASSPLTHAFSFSKERQFEPLRDADEQIVGVLLRDRNPISGTVDVFATRVSENLFKVTVRIQNGTPFEVEKNPGRDAALLSSLISAHTVLGTQDGSFVSLTAPPEQLNELVASCQNLGTWPVLVGEEGQRDTLLSSPIILYDYPEIAPESAGDLFDGTEIDEILSLRIMTLTDDEKREMSQSDERARQMLERTETMPVEQLMKLHGVLRGLRPLKEGSQ